MIETIVIGHLGRDAQVNDVNGKKVINFSLAHSEKFKDQHGQQQEKTIWVECALWRDNTTIAQYLKRGTQLFVRGIPNVETYRNRDNVTMAKLRLRVQEVQLLGGKRDQAEAPAKLQQPYQSVPPTAEAMPADATDDDLPF